MVKRASSAGIIVEELNALRRVIREQKKIISDQRWEIRSMRVQLYATEVFAKQFADKYRNGFPACRARAGDPRIEPSDTASG